MPQDTTTTLLIISVLGTARIYVILLAGILASKWPKQEALLNEEACRSISRICAHLFLPALVISSTGATLSPAALRDSWQLVVAGVMTIGLSVFLSGLLGRLLLQPEDRRAFRPVQLAVAFPNCLGFPLLLMESLCEQDDINRDFDDNAGECFTQATGLLITCFTVWQVLFYGWGYYAIGDDNTLELKLTGQRVPSVEDGHAASTPAPSTVMAQTERSGTVHSTHSRTAGDIEAAIDVPGGNVLTPRPPRARASHDVESAQLETASTDSLGDPAPTQVASIIEIAEGTGDGVHETAVNGSHMGLEGMRGPARLEGGIGLRLAAEPAQREMFRVLKRFASGLRISEWLPSLPSVAPIAVEAAALASGKSTLAMVQHRLLVVLTSPNIISVLIGLVIAMVFQLQQQLFGNPQAILRPLGAAIETLGTPTVAGMTLVMAGSLAQTSAVEAVIPLEGGRREVQWNMHRFRFIASAVHIFCRLVLVPAAGFAIFWVVSTYSAVLGENRLMHLIMLVQLGMPSAALVIVSLNQLEMPKTAGFMARLYLSQYGASMFTITLWTALAVHMVY